MARSSLVKVSHALVTPASRVWSRWRTPNGAPPHGGSAPGVDRIVMLLAGVENLREVIVFPFNQQAQDLMMNAAGEVSAKQLKELHIRVAE